MSLNIKDYCFIVGKTHIAYKVCFEIKLFFIEINVDNYN